MPLTLKKRGKTYWVRGTVRGISCYETTGTTEKALAEEYRAQREAELYRQAIHGQKATVSFRSEEHTSELQSLMRNSYDVFCLKKKTKKNKITQRTITRIKPQ